MANGIARLDIGCGEYCAAGYTPWDIRDGRSAEVLEGIPDASLDAIRASHVLEHVPYERTMATLSEWSRALRMGGTLDVAVPDFDKLVDDYRNGIPNYNIERVLLGGHTDANDSHHAIFNRTKLVELCASVGLDYAEDWTGTPPQCNAHPASLNCRFVKRGRARFPLRPLPDVVAVSTVPRLLWTENIQAIGSALTPLGIPMRRATGVFWGQCLQRIMVEALDTRATYILAVDYDTIFDAHDVMALHHLMEKTKLDALCALQVGRDRDSLIGTIDDGTGNPLREMPRKRLAEDYWPVLFGHFGLTLIRLDALRKLPRPWFLGQPDANGEWSEQRVDDDVYFWRKARAAGWRVGTTPLVRVGHLQNLITWPGVDLEPVFQFCPAFHEKGRPQW